MTEKQAILAEAKTGETPAAGKGVGCDEDGKTNTARSPQGCWACTCALHTARFSSFLDSACFPGPPFCSCRCGGMQALAVPSSHPHNQYEMGHCDWPGLGHVLAQRCRRQGTAVRGLSESCGRKGPGYSSKEVQGGAAGAMSLSCLMVCLPQIFTGIALRMSATPVCNNK